MYPIPTKKTKIVAEDINETSSTPSSSSSSCSSSSSSVCFRYLLTFSEAVVRRCSVKKVFLKISQNSQENT